MGPTASPSPAPTLSPTGTCNGIPDPEICVHFGAEDCDTGLGLELYCFYLCDTCVVIPTEVPTPHLTESPATAMPVPVPTLSPTGTCFGRPDAPICARFDSCEAGFGLEQVCFHLCGTCVTTTATEAPTGAPTAHADPLLLARGPCLMRPLDLVVMAHITEAMVADGTARVAQTFVRGLFRGLPFAPYGVRAGLVSNVIDGATNTTVGIGLADGNNRVDALTSLANTGSWSGSVQTTSGTLQDTLGKVGGLALHDRLPPVVSAPPGCSPDTAAVCSAANTFICSNFLSVAASCPASCGTCEPPVVEQCRGNYLRFGAEYTGTGRHRCRCGPDCHFCAHNGTNPGRCTKVRVNAFILATLSEIDTRCNTKKKLRAIFSLCFWACLVWS